MDLEEWEVLSDEGMIDLQEDDQKIANNNNNNNSNNNSPKFKSKNIYMDYFQKFEDLSSEDHEIKDQNFGVLGHKSHDHQEMIPKENQFVDTKIVEVSSHVCAEPSPASAELAHLFCKPAVEDSTKTDSPPESLKYEKDGNFEVEKVKEGEKMVGFEEKVVKMEENMRWKSGENGVWKWAMNGMGALVSFGVVVASVSLIVFSNQQKENKCSKNQELHFQFYSHDKRFKQVMRRAKRLNEAISVMRGAPLTTAHITVGGYYEAL